MPIPTHDASPFERILVRQVAATDPMHRALFHLWWSAPTQGERVVQVYANGQLDAVTFHPAQREVWLLYPPGRARALELIAVAPADAFVSRGVDDAVAPGAYGCASIALGYDPAQTRGTMACVTVDSSEPMCAPLRPTRSINSGEHRPGASGPEGHVWRWRSEPLPAGDHTLAVTQRDAIGRTHSPPITERVFVDRLPAAPCRLAISNGHTLSWS